MKIIISPAKKMNVDTDTYQVTGLPVFLEDTKLLMDEIKSLTFAQAKELWKCNDRLAQLNYDRFRSMDVERCLTPAVLTYEGLQYQHMAPEILSGFYGVLKPFDGVTPYRLEMQARLSVKGKKDLYDFWGDRLYRELTEGGRLIINLASREYSKAVEKYLEPKDRFLTVEFDQLKDGKVKQKATLAKMARGEMVRFMAENNVCDPEDIKNFRALGFRYSKERSDKNKMIFLAEQDKK